MSLRLFMPTSCETTCILNLKFYSHKIIVPSTCRVYINSHSSEWRHIDTMLLFSGTFYSLAEKCFRSFTLETEKSPRERNLLLSNRNIKHTIFVSFLQQFSRFNKVKTEFPNGQIHYTLLFSLSSKVNVFQIEKKKNKMMQIIFFQRIHSKL